MFMPWKVMVALVVAGAATLAIALGLVQWWNVSGLDYLKASGLELLSMPAMAGFVVAVGFVWWRLFSTVLGLLERDGR
ncbi:MAG: hypothetical protein EXQ85_04600 [Alphaproteobacteria bacterium]|nr:hypothetical protein [Alphaproteobacteria bacterium]